MRDTDPAPASSSHVRISGIVVPTAVVCALITAVTNWLMRPTATVQAAPDAAQQDIRELRADEKEILRRLGALEDASKNLNDSVDRLRGEIKK